MRFFFEVLEVFAVQLSRRISNLRTTPASLWEAS